MNQKCLEILKYLSSQETPVTANKLAEITGVSSRTVKSYVLGINSEYSNLIRSGKNGYSGDKNRIYEIIYHLQNEQLNSLPQSYEERSRFLIKRLMDAKELELEDLSDEIFVSSQTLINDIRKMNTQFEQYKVSFRIDKGKVSMNGTEGDKRRFISVILKEEASNTLFDISYLEKQFEEYDVETVSRRIKEIFDQNGFYLNEFNYSNLVLHIMIIISRNNYEESYSDEFADESILNLAKQISEMIKEECDVELSANSITQLSVLLLCHAINPEKTVNPYEISSDRDIASFVDELIEKIKDDYGVDLSNDIFRLPFLLHLNNLYNRLANNLMVYNPLGDGIRKSCPTIYEIAVGVALEIKNRWNYALDEDEVAFIALHIGGELQRQQEDEIKQAVVLVAMDYHELRSWLYNQVIVNFGSRVRISGFCDRVEDVEDKEAIIIALQNNFNKNEYRNTISVKAYSPLPNMEIIEVLDRVKANESLKVLFNGFDAIFKKELFIADAKGDSQQLLWQMSKLLLNDDSVTNHFYQRVLSREEASCTAFGRIAIPHSTKFDGLKTEICVAISPEGIKWRENIVNLVFLISVNKIDSIYFRDIFGALIQLFEDDDICDKLTKCHTFADFKSTILSYQ